MDLLGFCAKLEVTAANWTVLPYLSWVNVKCKLKGNNQDSNIIILPMLVTDSVLDHPLIDYNVLKQLISICDTSSETDELICSLSSSLPNVADEYLNSLVQSIR